MSARARDRGQMVPRGMNRWLLRVYLGTGLDGKRRYSSRTIEGTTAQARKELTAMLRALDTQTFVEPSRLTLEEYLKGWLAGKIDVTGATRESYDRQTAYFTGSIGHKGLGQVSPEDVQRVLSEMTAKGLSRRTLQYARAVLHAAFQDAMQSSLVMRNPTANTKLPPRVRRAPTVLSMRQASHLLESTKATPFYPLWAVLLTTGLRPQEALALKWSDIDLAGKWLSVQRALVDTGGGHYELVEATKTEGSTRRIGLAETTVEALKAQRRSQSAITPLNLVFCTPRGTPLDISKVRRAWTTAIKRVNEKLTQERKPLLPIVRLYDTRHSHATALLASGADIAWVQARLGHTKVQTTIDHYAHVLPETHRAMGEMTERILAQAGKR